VSIGIATSDQGTETAGHLVASADAALYYAKDHGRNLVVHATDLQAAREAGEMAAVV
jgi:PleD family two-component response regulator